jgi:hypothetical protein
VLLFEATENDLKPAGGLPANVTVPALPVYVVVSLTLSLYEYGIVYPVLILFQVVLTPSTGAHEVATAVSATCQDGFWSLDSGSHTTLVVITPDTKPTAVKPETVTAFTVVDPVLPKLVIPATPVTVTDCTTCVPTVPTDPELETAVAATDVVGTALGNEASGSSAGEDIPNITQY